MKVVLPAILIFLSNFLFAQNSLDEYHLIGIDDSIDYKIRTREDLEKDIVTFLVNENVLSVYDVRQIDTVINHLNRFLEVKLVIRGGSGVKNREKILLSANGGKLYISLRIVSDVESRLTEVYDRVADSLKLFDEESQYHVKISIEKRGDEFIATLAESNYVRSKFDPSQNEFFENVYQLNFDRSQYYFFNSTKDLNGKFRLYSYKNNTYSDEFLSLEAPCIKLTHSSYFFIDKIWYDEGRENYLFFR